MLTGIVSMRRQMARAALIAPQVELDADEMDAPEDFTSDAVVFDPYI